MNEQLIGKVFNNPYLLSEIIFYAFTDIIGDMRFRLVNRSFNNAHRKATKLEFRRMEIKYRKEEEIEGNTRLLKCFFINGRRLRLSKMWPFLDFLNQVVHLKVEELAIKDFQLEAKAAKYFHYKLHSTLIANSLETIRSLTGLERVCDGCSDCLKIAKIALEYGPIGLGTLQKLEKSDNSRTFIITDVLLEDVANHCIRISSSKDECLKEVQKLINPLHSQSKLILWISESRESDIRVWYPDHLDMPLEVLEMFFKIWNSESIQIHFIYNHSEEFWSSEWIDSGYFTSFRFNDPNESATNPSLKLENVTVDFSESFYCARDWECTDTERFQLRGYDNLLININKLCKTDQIFIKNYYLVDSSLEIIQSALDRLLPVVRKGNQSNITINIEVLARITDFRSLNSNAETEKALEMPEELTSVSQQFCSHRFDRQENVFTSPEGLRMMRWIGKRFSMEDDVSKLKFRLDLYMNECIFKHRHSKEIVHKRVEDLFMLFD